MVWYRFLVILGLVFLVILWFDTDFLFVFLSATHGNLLGVVSDPVIIIILKFPNFNIYILLCRRRSAGDEDGSEPVSGSQFSFLEFGSDEQGSYKTFKPKHKRSVFKILILNLGFHLLSHWNLFFSFVVIFGGVWGCAMISYLYFTIPQLVQHDFLDLWYLH